MGRSKTVIVLAGLLLFPALLFAQFNNNTSSPYSRFGLGDLQPYSFGRASAMGGASLASRNNQYINLSNPASYTSVDSLTFLFEFGLSGQITNHSTGITDVNSTNANFRYFAMNFQITNWMAASLGLTPYSDIGYNVEIQEQIGNVGNILNRYYGEGTLSKAFLGVAVEPVKNISVGANLNYLFGLLNRNTETYFLDPGNFYNNQKFESFRLRDFNFSFGAQAILPLDENSQFTFAAVFENKPKYTGFYSDITSKYVSIPVGNTSISDFDSISFHVEDPETIEFPLTYGFGISYKKINNLEVNADYYHQTWSKVELPWENGTFLTDLDRFAVGGEWIPERFSISSYFKRIAYRAGMKYEKSYLMIDGQQINDFGISFGVGIPVYRSNSAINISAELGKRGTTDNNLVLEKYAKLNISVNLFDIWFVQRRFD